MMRTAEVRFEIPEDILNALSQTKICSWLEGLVLRSPGMKLSNN